MLGSLLSSAHRPRLDSTRLDSLPVSCRVPCASQGQKITTYHRAQHEIFARFGDSSQWNGLVERLVLFADDARTQVCRTQTHTRPCQTHTWLLHNVKSAKSGEGGGFV